MGQVVVVPESLRDSAGTVTWWRLSGQIGWLALSTAWAALGGNPDDMPALPSDQVALRRALRSYEQAHVLIRALPHATFAVIDESLVEAQNDYEYATRFRVWIDSGHVVTDGDNELALHLQAMFNAAKNTYEATDLSSWFVDRVNALHAVSLRDRGGIYFVPETGRAAWSQFGDMLRTVSECRIYEIPAMQSEKAVEAVLDALVREARAEAETLEAALGNAEMGPRALRTRQARCDAMASKVSTYEDLLGTKLDDLRGVFTELQARAVQAIITAELAS